MKRIHSTINILLINIFILLFLQCNSVYSQRKTQSMSLSFNIEVDTVKTRVYTPRVEERGALKTVVLNMAYGGHHILNPEDAEVLNKPRVNIVSIDIVYTDFLKSEIHKNHNLSRIAELYSIVGSVFDQSLTKWTLIEQLGYYDEEDAKKLFHGVVIKYFTIPEYTPFNLSTMMSGVKSTKIMDSTIYNFFEKYPEYKKELVCVDMTGSMNPYYMELFVWMSLKQKRIKFNYVFFNDGDNLADRSKQIGKTGGLYMGSSNKVDSILGVAYSCIMSGSGGDIPENDIEAILKGLEKFPKTKHVILIADNWSNMRDYSLLKKIKVPVHVIVCGTNYYGIKSSINPQYLDLAYQTKGSIHTIEEDILRLSDIKEGGTIIVGGDKFILKGKKFIKK